MHRPAKASNNWSTGCPPPSARTSGGTANAAPPADVVPLAAAAAAAAAAEAAEAAEAVGAYKRAAT